MKFGIIGSNFIVDEFLKAAKTVDDFEFVAMYSRNIGKAKSFGEKHGATRFYDDYIQMFDEKKIEAVYIASPIALHFEQAKAALKRGIHVLLEKVSVLKAIEMEELMMLSKKNQVTFMEAMIPTTTPAFQVIKEYLSQIGTLRKVIFSYHQYSSRYDKFKKGVIENAFNPKFGGGALTDIGVYLIEPCVHLFGMPDRIIGHNFRLHNGIIGQGSAIFAYPTFDVVLMYSKIIDTDIPCQIIGEEGRLEFQQINRLSKITLKRQKEERRILYDEFSEYQMKYEIMEFIRCAKNKQCNSSVNPQQLSLDTVKLMEILNQL